jgi:ABC-type transporter Mla MlaB component
MATPPPERTVSFSIHGPIDAGDLEGLCRRICALLTRSSAATGLCDVRGVAADAATVDALARLQLAARRTGCTIRLRHSSAELHSLVAFMGLANVLVDEDADRRRRG